MSSLIGNAGNLIDHPLVPVTENQKNMQNQLKQAVMVLQDKVASFKDKEWKNLIAEIQALNLSLF